MYRWATSLPDGVPIVITDAAGVDHEYRGGPDISWTEEFALFAESAAPPVISLDLPFNAIDNIPQRVADGDDLSAMTLSLYRWSPGVPFEDRRGFFFGIAQEPTYGGVSEPVSVTFESPLYRDGGLWPEGRVEAGQITVDASLADGQPYPVVFGAPRFIGGVSSAAAGSPAYPLVAADRTVLAGVILGDSSAGTLWNTTQDAVETSTSASDQDLSGRAVVVFTSTHAMPISGITRSGGLATATTSSAHDRESGDVVTVSGADQSEYNITTRVTVTSDTTFVYPVSGTPATPATGTITSTIFNAEDDYAIEWIGDPIGAGELLEICARASTLRVDHSRMSVVRARLNDFKLSGYIDTEVSPWDWALRNIMPLLPASAHHTPEGLAVRVWDDTATADDSMASIDTANGFVRIGRVQYENAEVLNEVTIRYQPDFSGEYQSVRTVTGRLGLGSPPEVIVSPYARASVSRMAPLDAAGPLQGVRSKVIESRFVADDATALRVAMWMIRARSSRRRAVTYRDTQGHAEWLEEGEHVTLTDPGLALSGHLAMVRSRRWQGGSFFIDLVLIDDILTR